MSLYFVKEMTKIEDFTLIHVGPGGSNLIIVKDKVHVF